MHKFPFRHNGWLSSYVKYHKQLTIWKRTVICLLYYAVNGNSPYASSSISIFEESVFHLLRMGAGIYNLCLHIFIQDDPISRGGGVYRTTPVETGEYRDCYKPIRKYGIFAILFVRLGCRGTPPSGFSEFPYLGEADQGLCFIAEVIYDAY